MNYVEWLFLLERAETELILIIQIEIILQVKPFKLYNSFWHANDGFKLRDAHNLESICILKAQEITEFVVPF